MPRTALPVTSVPTPYATDGQAVTWTAADVANGNDFPANGRRVLLARNTGAEPHTVTIHSAAIAPSAREGDITADSIAAGATHVYPLFPLRGWQQPDGKMHVNADHAEIVFAVIDLR